MIRLSNKDRGAGIGQFRDEQRRPLVRAAIGGSDGVEIRRLRTA